MTVSEPEIPTRKATPEENKPFAEEMGKAFSIAGDALILGSVGALGTSGLQHAAPELATIGTVASAIGSLIENGGAWVGDHLGRRTVDMDRVPKRIQEHYDKYEGSSQDDTANMIY
ncbi:hypothetical protein JCM15519_28450 [Fundidesulfovibrio butyratiphilus]